jgi:hypothetical protein
MIWSGGMAWIADFPDPSNFYGPILGCAGAGEGGWNWSKYCNEDLDAKAARPTASPTRPSAADRLKMWSDVYMASWRRALGAGLQRTALHDEVAAHGRRGCALRRSGLDPGQLRLRRGMCKACDYTIHGAQHHFGWDNTLPPG